VGTVRLGDKLVLAWLSLDLVMQANRGLVRVWSKRKGNTTSIIGVKIMPYLFIVVSKIARTFAGIEMPDIG
jgi:hypothetical protein